MKKISDRMNKIVEFWNSRFLRSRRGVMLLELILAVSLFALGMVTMAMMFFAFLSGSKIGTYRPHADRQQIEAVCRAMDQDFQNYRPIFAYNVELQDPQNNNSWVLPRAIVLGSNGARPYDFQQQYKVVPTDPNVPNDPLDPNLVSRLTSNDNFIIQTGLQPIANNASRKAFTLLFLGMRGAQAGNGRYMVFIDVVYHILVTVQNNPTRMVYEIARIQRDEGGAKGITHYVTFSSTGFDNANPDQTSPEFFYEGNGVVQGSTTISARNIIRAVIPNPFSKQVVNTVTSSTVYQTPMMLRYYLSTTGL